MRLNKLFAIILFSVGVGFAPASANALELNLTPNHVLSIWTNINDALVAVGGSIAATPPSARDLQNANRMSAVVFADKTPGDVLGQLTVIRARLDAIAVARNLDISRVYVDPDGAAVTPSVVFLNSGHVLDTLVRILNDADPDLLAGGFYAKTAYEDKTPSDVFGLIDLVSRRLDLLL
ncbi:MAG: hypothetical protein HOB82_02145 [Alphaproteobacteria bacterium]|nr:hypothetical protein [Alphaproteobacteria bacterium]